MAARRVAPGARAAAAALALVAVLLCARGAAAQDLPPGTTVTTENLCFLLGSANILYGQATACNLVNLFMSSIIYRKEPDACPDLADTSFGRQVQPFATPAKDLPAKTKKKGVPTPLTSRGSPQYFTGSKLKTLLKAEGPTFHWLWQTLRNVKYFWPCSKAFNGSIAGYLVPEGWQAVGGTTAPGSATPITPGIYSWQQEWPKGTTVAYPFLAVLKKPAARHMVFAMRAANTPIDWKTGLYYERVKGHTFKGEAFSGNAFEGATHEGVTGAFDQLWPDVQALIKSEIINAADKKSAPKDLTFAGHSIGGAMATMLAFATKRYLDANKVRGIRIGVVTFGVPAIGDSAFVESLKKAKINMRRIVFEHDIYSIMVCNSTAAAGADKAMPACPNTLVPTPNPDGTTYWNDYQHAAGGIFLTHNDMPIQQEAWDALKTVPMDDYLKFRYTYFRAHACSYACYFRQFAEQPDDKDSCAINAPAEAGHGVCDVSGFF